MSFPPRFDPVSWKGPRAMAHPDRSDAFQQLVGDALREEWGMGASVAPTEGRDGGPGGTTNHRMQRPRGSSRWRSSQWVSRVKSLGRLEQFHEAQEAQFVVQRPLGRSDLGAHAPKSINFALTWLVHFLQKPAAQFVLNPLLGRTDLEGHSPLVFEIAMDWLEKFPQDWRASTIFCRLFAHAELGIHAPRAISLAIAWLEERPLAQETKVLFDVLLQLPQLPNADWTHISGIALNW